MINLHYVLGGLVLIAFSCKKPEPVPPPSPDAAALILFSSEKVGEATQHFTEDATLPIAVTGSKGTGLYLPANSLVDSEGNLVTGNVDIELIEITQKSEMVLLEKPTNGKMADGTIAPLNSAGELFIRITQLGNELTLTTPMSVSLYTTHYSPHLRKFVDTSTDDDILWEIANDSIITFEEEGGFVILGFDILPNEWGWVNCDFFKDDPRPKTSCNVTLPEGFSIENTNVFVSIDGENALAQFGSSYEFPIGADVHFVAIGIVDDAVHYSIQEATITDNHVENIDGFAAVSESTLVTLIEALP